MILERDKAINLLRQANITFDDWDIYDVARKLRHLGLTRDDFSVSDGASKFCIVFKKRDYVIKWCSERGYSEAAQEAKIYREAVEAGLGMFFPKTAILCEMNGITFVVQEKIGENACELKESDKKYYDRIGRTAKDSLVHKMEKEFHKASSSYPRKLDSRWAKVALSIYGKKACKDLCAFIIQKEINDLHSENIGFKNGKPLILDFSGYHRG